MNTIKAFLATELSHYRKLSDNAQKLLTSIALFVLINPIFGIFINAYIWRQSQDLLLVSYYNVIVFLGIPFGFYLNGLLLRKFSPSQLYFLGMLLGGLMVANIIFLPKIDYLTIGLLGLIDGIAGGIYWANRNLLTLKTTHTDNRIYFSGIESILSTYSKIIIPLIIGWFIVLGAQTGLYSEITGYKITALIMLGIIGLAGIQILPLKLKPIAYKQLLLHHVSSAWRKFQLLQIILGFLQGVGTLLPTIMILTLVGKEEALGTVQAVSSILTAFVVYILAKRLQVKHRLKLLQISFFMGLLGAVAFGISYTGLGVIIFYICQAISVPFLWIATSSLNYDLIDNDKNELTHYAYISDQEIYLNGGRIAAIGVFMLLIYFFSNEIALRITPIIFAISQIGLSLLAKSIESSHKNT